jgi:predicted nuclease of predicted toxin-antitoxin system
MWLLDANMPVQLVALLKELGIEADSAVARGWNTLGNGSLVSAAVQANFTALLTRDRLFGESAAHALKAHSEFCVVRVTLPQLRADEFLQAFRATWQTTQIIPAPGRLIDWPMAQVNGPPVGG